MSQWEKQDTAMNVQFKAWLVSGDTSACTITQSGSTYIFLRAAKTPRFDYLYCQRHYHECGVKRRDDFEYAGMYDKKAALIYDGQYDIRQVAGTDACADERSPEYMTVILEQTVRALVEAAIDNDRSRLQVREISDKRLLDRLNNYRNYYAREEVRKEYLENEAYSEPVFHCHYSPDSWAEDTLLAYISDPEAFAQREAAAYMAANQEAMLLEFLENDALQAEHEALIENPKNPIHTVKRIMAAVSAANAKTVHVTVNIAGTKFSFKTEASALCRDCTRTYNSWDMVAADRRAFERTFGRNAEYGPLDIVRITYGKATIYERVGGA